MIKNFCFFPCEMPPFHTTTLLLLLHYLSLFSITTNPTITITLTNDLQCVLQKKNDLQCGCPKLDLIETKKNVKITHYPNNLFNRSKIQETNNLKKKMKTKIMIVWKKKLVTMIFYKLKQRECNNVLIKM